MNDLSDHEKSVMIARVMGQAIRFDIVEGVTNKYKITISGPLFENSWMADRHKSISWEQISTNTRREIISNPDILQACLDANTPDLYHPANMALAWRALNYFCADLVDWLEAFSVVAFSIMKPQEVQHIILDKILKLAIEAGLIEVK